MPRALRFDREETRQFLERENLGPLSSVEVEELTRKTDGWQAVLRIIATTSLQKGIEVGEYVRRSTAAQRPIDDYLAEMLPELPEDIFEFMLRTAIVDLVSASLATAITKVDGSRDLLESMEARQLLAAPLDREARWYRYH